MCGIGGYFLRPGAPAPAGLLDRMDAALAHRGPDGSGRFEATGVGFIHRRLSIIDLANGAQPFTLDGDGGTKALIANGEIYNHAALRAELGGGFDFRSQSDCETLFALWAQHGTAILPRLRGMYAAAMVDTATGDGFLLRDPFGIKPLYYHEHETGVYFASEPAALRGVIGDQDMPDPLHAACIIDRQFAPDRMPAFSGIKRVAPGSCLRIHEGRIVEAETDHPLLAITGPSQPKEFESRLHDSVAAHLMSDVPLGLFFSGGVDSSAILASMAALRDAGRAPAKDANGAAEILSYTVRFDLGGDDETALAKTLAEKAGASFVDVPYGKADFWRDAGRAALACDDPAADYAILPTLHLAARAARDVKVILSGEGGDEFFAGYGRYRAGLRHILPKFPARPGPALRAGLFPTHLQRELTAVYDQERQQMPTLTRRMFDRGGALSQLQLYDIQDWLPNDLLIKLDRCLMRHGLEGRTPFVDRQLSSYGYALPLSAKLGKAGGKHIVKSWLARVMPDCRPFARKRGFTVPVGAWIAEEASQLAPLVARQPGIAPLISETQLTAVFSAADGRTGLLAWRILFYALWHQVHCMKVDANAPVADILAMDG